MTSQKKIFEVGSRVKIDQDQIHRSGHEYATWSHTDEIYTISKILKISPDDYKVVELDRRLPTSDKRINTFYLRLLTQKEIRKQKLEKINENRR